MEYIVEYDIVGAENLTDLVKAINKKTREGWIPHGNLTKGVWSHMSDTMYWIQPIIRKVENLSTDQDV